MYGPGTEQFFADWLEFAETSHPRLITRTPKLVLIARSYKQTTQAALENLVETGIPIQVIEVTVYEEPTLNRRFLRLQTDFENELAAAKEPVRSEVGGVRVQQQGITLADLIAANLLRTGDRLIWRRPRLQQTYYAHITESGTIKLEDGGEFSTPSSAAAHAANIPAYDGWLAWHVERPEGSVLLDSLRKQLVSGLPEPPEDRQGDPTNEEYRAQGETGGRRDEIAAGG